MHHHIKIELKCEECLNKQRRQKLNNHFPNGEIFISLYTNLKILNFEYSKYLLVQDKLSVKSQHWELRYSHVIHCYASKVYLVIV